MKSVSVISITLRARIAKMPFFVSGGGGGFPSQCAARTAEGVTGEARARLRE